MAVAELVVPTPEKLVPAAVVSVPVVARVPLSKKFSVLIVVRPV
jgi:hypothetical protein